MHAQQTPGSRTIVSPFFLFGCTLLTLISIAFILHRLSGLAYHEQPIVLQPATQATGTPVTVGLYIDNFDKFNVIAEEFILNGLLTFEFEEKKVTPEQLNQITFARAKVLHRSEPAISTEHGRTRVHYQVRVQLFEDLDFAWFPFEDHQLSIMLVDRSMKSDGLLFTTDLKNFTVPETDVKGWHKFNTHTQTGYLEEHLNAEVIRYPAAVFSIDYGRYTNIRNIFMILLPMLLLFFIALFSLIIDPRNNFTFVLTIPVSAIVGLISFRFVVEAMSPKVGYFMYSDYFFVLFLSLVFAILIFHTFGYSIGSLVRKVMIVLFDLIVILFCFFMVYHIDTVFKAVRG